MARVSKAVGLQRLTKLALFLLTVPEEKFNFGEWFVSPEKPEDNACSTDAPCGTTACALGWAPSVKSFRKLGVKLHTFRSDDWDGHNQKPIIKYRAEVVMPGSKFSIHTASRLFGISLEDAEYLFTPDSSGLSRSATVKKVADHILAYVANQTKF